MILVIIVIIIIVIVIILSMHTARPPQCLNYKVKVPKFDETNTQISSNHTFLE